MKTFEQKKAEALSIADPKEAYLKVALDEELLLTEMEEIIQAYTEKHGVEEEEMAYYPNGERVLTAEIFRASRAKHREKTQRE